MGFQRNFSRLSIVVSINRQQSFSTCYCYNFLIKSEFILERNYDTANIASFHRLTIPKWMPLLYSNVPSQCISSFRLYSTSQSPRPMNENVSKDIIILIDDRGLNLGQKKKDEVLSSLNRQLYNLVEVGKRDDMPICKILPKVGSQKEKAKINGPTTGIIDNKGSSKMTSKTNSSEEKMKTKIKELIFGTNIAENDFDRKVNQLEEFLKKGYLVQIWIKETGSSSSETVITTNPSSQPSYSLSTTTKKLFMKKIMDKVGKFCSMKGSVKESMNHLTWSIQGIKFANKSTDESAHKEKKEIVEDDD